MLTLLRKRQYILIRLEVGSTSSAIDYIYHTTGQKDVEKLGRWDWY